MSGDLYDPSRLLSPWGLAAMAILALVLVLLIVFDHFPKQEERRKKEKD